MLGPVLFTLYTTPLSAPFSVFDAKESLEQLNASKTEFPIGTKLKREKMLNNIPCLILGQNTNPSARKGT